MKDGKTCFVLSLDFHLHREHRRDILKALQGRPDTNHDKEGNPKRKRIGRFSRLGG